MLFSSDGELEAIGFTMPPCWGAPVDAGECTIGEALRGIGGDPCGTGAAAGTGAGGDTDTGRCCCADGGELEAARGRGLLLRLRGPPEFEPGVTASNADPRPDGKLYGENR